MLKGIDVSEHQGTIDWNQVKGNIDFAILRAGYGSNNIDKQFIRNITECNRLGIRVGIYWFSYAYTINMARNEANFAVQAIKNYKIDLPIFFDFEYDSINYANKCGININQRLATDMVKAFCERIKELGYKPGNYSNQDFILNKFYNNELTQYPLWFAYYNQNKNRDCMLWQYSENGRVPGINTDSVDMNYCYTNLGEVKPVVNLHVKELWEISIQGDEVKALQEELNRQFKAGLKVDGLFGEDTLNACVTLREGVHGNLTRLVQRRLINRGYNLNPYNDDGDFGDTTLKAVKRLQDCFNLIQDGIVGRNTWKALYGLDKGRF
ncbi:GH25 family lysozyme [Clostridium thermobutyricum]|uniref:GH25 family lysozyme n=1 Tax=Clostridium thermobutyricum TaxID=29372 RepID=UPI0018A9A1ED|nr:GH25 family lysozyme [Clostridium thermobutyricum]